MWKSFKHLIVTAFSVLESIINVFGNATKAMETLSADLDESATNYRKIAAVERDIEYKKALKELAKEMDEKQVEVLVAKSQASLDKLLNA